MSELPEFASRAKEMKQALTGKMITSIEVKQPKYLNRPVEEFANHLYDTRIESTSYHGKWIQTLTSGGYILLKLGTGGEILLTDRGHLPTGGMKRAGLMLQPIVFFLIS